MKYQAVLEEDVFGEIFLSLPQELLDEVGWVEGDVLNVDIENDAIILTKKKINHE